MNNCNYNVSDEFDERNPFSEECTFDRYVVGESNAYAYKLAKYIAENPLGVNNRACIYGDCGVGKTHLLLAIGNYILNHNEKIKVRYTTMEQFHTDFIKALSQNQIKKFQERYRSVDILLVDDIQFLERKSITQEELFHVIEALERDGKGFVFSGTVSPYNLHNIDNKELKSRLKGCITAQIEESDYDSRTVILNRYIFTHDPVAYSYSEREAVVDFIASIVGGDNRHLIGAWKRVSNFAEILDEPITLEFAKKLLQDKMTSVKSHKSETGLYELEEPVVNDFDTQYICEICITATFLRGNIAKYTRTNVIGDEIVGRFSIDETKINEINFLDDLMASVDFGTIFRHLTNDTNFDLDELMSYYYEDYECEDCADKSKGWQSLKEDSGLSDDVLACCYEKYKQDLVNKAIFIGELALYGEHSDIKSLTIEKRYPNAEDAKYDKCYVKNFEIV